MLSLVRDHRAVIAIHPTPRLRRTGLSAAIQIIMHATPFGPNADQKYMSEALKQAQRAFDRGEVPVGAVVVAGDGTIIGRGYNAVEARVTQQAHAEMIALERAATKQGGWRLTDCWLYVTLEPCVMCMGMSKLSRIAGIVYGASSPLFGYRLDSEIASSVYNNGVFPVQSGVRSDEAAALLKRFFRQKRKTSG